MTRRTRTQRKRFSAAAAAAVLSLVTACGSAVPHDEVVQAAQGGLPNGTSGVTAEGEAVGSQTGGDDTVAGGVVDPGTTVDGNPGSEADAVAGGSGGAAGSGGGGSDAAGGTAGTGGASGTATGGAGGTTTGGSAGGAGDKSPIIVGSVGNFSGPAGSLLKSSSIGAQVWASEVNAKGGIAGHPVKVIVADDQSDPARYRSILKDMVENKNVVAFVGNAASSTIPAGKSYLEEKKVPVVGSGDGDPTWQNSPMHFPIAGNSGALVFGNFAEAKRQGKTKIGLLTCVESASCPTWKNQARQFAPKIGVQLVYQAEISITQADFTSECLNARNAGAQVVAVIADSNTLYRVARSCGQQDYKPTYIAPAPDDRDAEKKDLEGAIGAMHTFPYFGVPGNKVADAFRAAVKKYAPDAPQQMYLATGYASGKVFEAAALKGIGTGKPSSAKVLEGLYGIPQNETLGGLVHPLRFKKGAPTKMVFCYYPAIIKGGKYTAPDGMKSTCPAV